MIGDTLSSGAHVTIDAVGSGDSITDCLRITRPRGRVVLLGMPADVHLDLTGLWHRETELKGAYTYGTEQMTDGSTARTFDLAIVRCDVEPMQVVAFDPEVRTVTVEAEAVDRLALEDDVFFSEKFLLPRPLLTALMSPEPVVLLIDEIDRADGPGCATSSSHLSDFNHFSLS